MDCKGLTARERLSCRFGILALLLFAWAGLCPAQATTLRITSQLPPTHPVTANLQAFEAAVAALCPEAELDFQLFHSAILYRDSEVPQAVSSGAIAMGTVSLTRFSGTVPAVDVFYVPFLLQDGRHVAAVTAPGAPARQLIEAALAETGVRVLWWQAGGNAQTMARKPLRLPADAAGLKIRVFGKTLGDFVTAIGAVPALTAASEQFLAYQRGTVDAGMSILTSIRSRKLYEVMDYLILTNHAVAEFVVVINERVWQGLTAAQQTCMLKAGRRVEAELRAQLQADEAAILTFIAEETGMQVIALTPDERLLWQEAAAPVRQSYLSASGPLGALLIEAIEAARQE